MRAHGRWLTTFLAGLRRSNHGRLLTAFLAALGCVAQIVAAVAQASGFGEWRYGPIVAAEMIAKTETVYKVRTPMPSGGPWLAR